MAQPITITDEQRKALRKLWFIYGNDGVKHGHHDHKYIQGIIEYNEDRTEDYGSLITEDCKREVQTILNSPLTH